MNHYYTLIIGFSLLKLFCLAVLVIENDRFDARLKKKLLLAYLTVAVAMSAEWLGVFLNGNPSVPASMIRRVKFFDYIATPVAAVACHLQIQSNSIHKKCIKFLLIANTAFQTVALFNDWMITVDSDNHYAHGTLYFIYGAINFFLILLIIAEYTQYGRRFQKRRYTSLFATVALLTAGVLIQEISGGKYRTIYLAITMGMALLTIHHAQYAQSNAAETIRQQQYALTASRIQPHFLCNSLGAIQYLCLCDSNAAAASAEKLSCYLRENLNFTTQDDLIPFTKELEHTKYYLDMEQMRFEASLEVIYDVTCTDFSLPALTLQPLVENAVHHGARQTAQETGRVTIATREYPDRFEITVSDNGPGLPPDAFEKNDGRSHVGISGVRDHLRAVCNGTLQIESAEGEGTTATIMIPKNSRHENETGEKTC